MKERARIARKARNRKPRRRMKGRRPRTTSSRPKTILASMAETLAKQKEKKDRIRKDDKDEEERVAANIDKKQKDEEKLAA